MGVGKGSSEIPRLVVWYGQVIFYFGLLCFPLAVLIGFGSYFYQGWYVWESLQMVIEAWGLAAAICGFGTTVARGVRDSLWGLLIIVAFASGLIGFLFMLGRNPEIGYYLWAIGGFFSLSLIFILVTYWKRLP